MDWTTPLLWLVTMGGELCGPWGGAVQNGSFSLWLPLSATYRRHVKEDGSPSVWGRTPPSLQGGMCCTRSETVSES